MARSILAPLLAAAALSGPAVAQTPPTGSYLNWPQAERERWFAKLEQIYPTHVAKAGGPVRALPAAAFRIDPKWRQGGKDWTVDSWMAAQRVSGVIVLKDGKVVLEKYGLGRTPQDRWPSQSVAKSITSLLAGAAVADGKLKLTDTVAQHVPELKGSAYETVTVKQVLTMSSGVKWNEAYLDPNSDLQRMGRLAATDPDAMMTVLKTLPRAQPAGTFHYNTLETHLAGLVVSRAVGKPLADYLSEKIWRPFGMEADAHWMVDQKGREQAGCCIQARLRDFARVGLFALENGYAGGRRVTPPGWIAESTKTQVTHDRPLPLGYGYFWWIGPRAYEASGIYGQSILVYPEEKIVVAINSAYTSPDAPELWAMLNGFNGAVFDALTKGS